ncbi:proliferating cell nuclear antigen [Cystoisospora suis]|uniref:DNA sliding clamp PCNA n=1 Tax=Cystoisospora suis TaxID=483139 RepID=A0A2C6LE49_9APIC|nr:proliferating cell nuclear antigen [Cystoisospora suis]
MFECTLEGLLLKRLMECLKDIVTDVNLVCTATGVSLISMDGSHVAVVDMRLDVDLFHKYRCDRAIQLGVSVPTLLLALQPCKSPETLVHLSSLHGDDEDDEENTILHISIEDPESGDSWSMEVRLLDVESEQLEVPENTEHEAMAVVKSKELQDLVRYLNSLSESIIVKMEKTHLVLSARGDSIAASRKMQPENLVCTSPTEHEFAARYLNMFLKGAVLGEYVEIGCSHGLPMQITFRLRLQADKERRKGRERTPDVKMDDDETTSNSTLSFYLAPRIADDEE